ncbi:hypothetical protein SO3561_08821 [Streptomyces olivochromogenes]|uniref:Uncharacterized protein n=1 Tax=Streptomyces olivochromogenes TaxID=1963 RepID=A0A250VSX6_STROL|nr:hypothetical protein SO3561_08821 [Streptomyces olivochromogenes]
MTAFLLWPLAVWQLTPRTIHHLYNALTQRKAP